MATGLTFVGSAEGSGNSADYSVSLSGLSLRQGDLVILSTGYASNSNGDPGPTTSGYTEVVEDYQNYSLGSRDTNFSVSWKIMGLIPDTSVTVKGSGSSSFGAVTTVHVWRRAKQYVSGASGYTPMDVTPTNTGGTITGKNDSPSITPSTAGSVVIATGMSVSTSADYSVTCPSGYSNQISATVDPGTAATMGTASKFWSGSGSEDPGAWSGWPNSVMDSWASASLAIRPANNDSPTVSLTSPISGNIANSVYPTLSFVGSDAESDTIEYNLQIDTVNTFNSGNLISKWSKTDTGFSSGHPFSSGATVTYTSPTRFSIGVTYYWRVRGFDTNAAGTSGSQIWGEFSTTQTFQVRGLDVRVDSSKWVRKPVKIYNGSTWVEKPVKVYNGSSWVRKG